jgi:hypothetical protein
MRMTLDVGQLGLLLIMQDLAFVFSVDASGCFMESWKLGLGSSWEISPKNPAKLKIYEGLARDLEFQDTTELTLTEYCETR